MSEKSFDQMIRETRSLATKIENDRLGKTIIQSFTNGEIRRVSNYGQGAQQTSVVIREAFMAGGAPADLDATHIQGEATHNGSREQEVATKLGDMSLNISGIFSPDRYAMLAPLE
jgi:hypothetical protein